MSGVDPKIAALGKLDLPQLRAVWSLRYGAPPATRTPELLRLMLGWRLQAEVHGGLDALSRRQLKLSGPLECEGRALGVGAKLTRQWQGERVEVVVTEDGFEWNGTSYKSLSSAATAIAGSRWNGPRFFGLRVSLPEAKRAEDRPSTGRATGTSTPVGNHANDAVRAGALF